MGCIQSRNSYIKKSDVHVGSFVTPMTDSCIKEIPIPIVIPEPCTAAVLESIVAVPESDIQIVSDVSKPHTVTDEDSDEYQESSGTESCSDDSYCSVATL